MPRRPELTKEQNERARAFLLQLMEQLGVNQVMLAPRIGMTQSALSRFLDPKNDGRGMARSTLEQMCRLLDRPVWEVLGEEPPELRLPPRALAAQLVKDFNVSPELIRQVLDEPKTDENAEWPAIVWANRILALHFQATADVAMWAASRGQKAARSTS